MSASKCDDIYRFFLFFLFFVFAEKNLTLRLSLFSFDYHMKMLFARQIILLDKTRERREKEKRKQSTCQCTRTMKMQNKKNQFRSFLFALAAKTNQKRKNTNDGLTGANTNDYSHKPKIFDENSLFFSWRSLSTQRTCS